MKIRSILPLLVVGACAETPLPPPPPPPPVVPAPPGPAIASPALDDAGTGVAAAPAAPKLHFTSKPVPLPGAGGPVSLDYLACDRSAGRVWIPAGDTASVDVLEVATGKLTRIQGFPTAEREVRGTKRKLGPSSATVGDGVAYVGNRGNSEVCAVDGAKLTKGACLALPTPPDGLQYVASVKEVWVTTPRDNSITVLDASAPAKLKVKTKVTLDGSPEGYAVDDGRGVFFTNLEDKDKTVSIDVKTHQVAATWPSQCGSDGPRGLAVDTNRNFLFVACTDHVETLDVAHGGGLLGKLDTGAGVDNIDYLASLQQLYVAAGKAATMTVAKIEDSGALTSLGTTPTSEGSRNVVVDGSGAAYATDAKQGQILVLSPGP